MKQKKQFNFLQKRMFIMNIKTYLLSVVAIACYPYVHSNSELYEDMYKVSIHSIHVVDAINSQVELARYYTMKELVERGLVN